ncbi:glycosyltransferase family 4 protein [Clostridium culturomicium]|uniref:glycosyltransferase family 4 protein n=1 Tax=Clostridium culturomicium TaxID=1499683 RepID=UPI0038579F45
MKVLWLCNIMLPEIAKELGRGASNGGGWLTGLAEDLKKEDNIELTVCFPVYNEESIKGTCNNIRFYGFSKQDLEPYIYEKNVEDELKSIIEEVKPDVVHIWGTEFPHSLAMTKICEKEKIVISIQGLCSVISNHYMAFLPDRAKSITTFRDFIRKDNLLQQQNKFKIRGEYEIQALKNCKNVIGRTTWDRASLSRINDSARYFKANETLRSAFYKSSWDLDSCEKYSIFLSQGSYPVKGLHLMIEAMAQVIKKYPTAHLYVAGEDITECNGIKGKLRMGSYAKYIVSLINELGLQEKISFLGNLNEEQMCERMTNSHVFVCPSSIENSPNSLGEAMLLGLPCVAAYVGGIPDMLEHNKEGYLYQSDAQYMLAYYICKVFQDDKLAIEFSSKSKVRAQETHNKEKNTDKIIEIYSEIYLNSKK